MEFFILFVVLCSLANLREVNGHCPPEWEYFDRHCYVTGKRKLSWTDASDACKARSGKLVEIKSAKKNTFIKLYAVKNKALCVWLGGTDMYKEGTWVWMSKGELIQSFTDWMSGQPDNFAGNENCLTLFTSLDPSWNDLICDYECHFICEREVTY